MTETTKKRTSKKALANGVVRKYKKPGVRTIPLGRLVDFLPGTPDPLITGARDLLIGRGQWESFDTRRRNQAVGFVGRDDLVARHQLRPPLIFSRTAKNKIFDKLHSGAIKSPKVVFRYKERPIAALAPKHTLPMSSLLGLAPRLKTTPTEDLPILLNSRLFRFLWKHQYPRRSATSAVPAEERLSNFLVPMLTKKTAGPFRSERDKVLKLAAANAERLAKLGRVQEIAEEEGVPLSPLGRTETIIREINVPKAITDVADVKRRGPVVIFRRGSTIVTTTEEAATYLELWLRQRFDQIRGLTKEQLEEFIQMPNSTAHVVIVLQHRARIMDEIDATQSTIDEHQWAAENHLYDLYGLTEEEREFLYGAYA